MALLTRLQRIEKRRATLARWQFLARLQTCSDEELTSVATNGQWSVRLQDLTTEQLQRLARGEHLASVLAEGGEIHGP